MSDQQELYLSKLFTLIWGVVFIGGAMFFKDDKNPVVELGLAIASFTYGGLLGVFFLGTFSKKIKEADALVAMWSAILFMTWIIGVHGVQAAIMVVINGLAAIWIWRKIPVLRHRLSIIALFVLMVGLIFFIPVMHFSWPWYVLIGSLVCMSVGKLLSIETKSR